jgi:hypothetical protein
MAGFFYIPQALIKSQFIELLLFKNLSVPCSWKEGSCFSCKLPKRRECNTAKTTMRAWGGLGGVALIAGAINGAPLQAASLGTFWAEPESTAPGRDPNRGDRAGTDQKGNR